jgi:hypothetical protein
MRGAVLAVAGLAAAGAYPLPTRANPPLYIAFHWHMHQPLYWPGESVVASANAGRYGFDLTSIHNDRGGPYTSWPKDAVQAAAAAGLGHCGAQVSFSGSLMENLDALEHAGRGFSGWRQPWRDARQMSTALGNPRLDLVNFGYFHPLMPLVEPRDVDLQVRLHRAAQDDVMGTRSSKGIFTPETAFHPRLIPTLAALGIEWAMVDNIHFDRARVDYPYSSGSNLYPPNGADAVNPTQPGAWVQLNNIWAPSRVSAPWGYRPHRVKYLDPATGQESSIIAVPAARYEGNEDARGGFGALQYEAVLSQYEAHNTDASHPMLVVLHHDGDNYGGGTDSYYHSNWSGFLSWVAANPGRFQCTTVQDYLDQFPPAQDDVIHVEPGSWSGADNGDPEFLKWNGDPGADGYSPDRNSWAVLTAARNWLATAESQQPAATLDNIRQGVGSAVERAWRWLLTAETSCYWYWDNSADGIWDSHPTRASNQVMDLLRPVVTTALDTVPPTIYAPQRDPYNPGAMEWGNVRQPSDFTVWTLVHDVSGVSNVTLRYRVDADGVRDDGNASYAGGTWVDLPMTGSDLPASRTNPAPAERARLYQATITGMDQDLLDYHVVATDDRGNTARTPLEHVFVGTTTAPGTDGGVPSPDMGHEPVSPFSCQTVTIWSSRPGALHWGVNGWHVPPAGLQPAGTTPWPDGLSVETPLTPSGGRHQVTIGPFDGVTPAVTRLDYVMHYGDNTWSSPPDRVVQVQAGCPLAPAPPGTQAPGGTPGSGGTPQPGWTRGPPWTVGPAVTRPPPLTGGCPRTPRGGTPPMGTRPRPGQTHRPPGQTPLPAVTAACGCPPRRTRAPVGTVMGAATVAVRRRAGTPG